MGNRKLHIDYQSYMLHKDQLHVTLNTLEKPHDEYNLIKIQSLNKLETHESLHENPFYLKLLPRRCNVQK